MKAKRIFAMAALCAPMFLASCSDDSTDGLQSSISIPGGNNSVTINREEGDYAIPVTATGRWTARLAADSVTWLTVATPEGEGSGNVEYFVEPNTGEEMRRADIILTAGDRRVTYTVTQTIVSEADDTAGENGAETDYSMFGQTVPVGYGMYIKGKSTMKRFNAGQIFRLSGLSNTDVQEELGGAEYVSTAELPTSEIKLQTGKELRDKEQDINANLSVNVQFGLFKLGLKGAFNMFGESTDTTYNYCATTTVPTQEVSLDYRTLLEDCEELLSQTELNRVLSKSFMKVRDSIQSLVANGCSDELLEKQLQKLDKDFGPVFCAGATLGGNANVSVTMTSSSTTDTMKISGELSATFTSLFSLDVAASADYLNTSRAYLNNSEISINVTGGTSTGRNTLIKAFGELADPNKPSAEVNESLISNIGTWAETIDGANPSTFTCTDYELIGIWELFTDDDAQEAVKEYMKKQYPNNASNGLSPYLVDIQAMADE